MTKVTITCPITWHEQCTWIRQNCTGWRDQTNWAAWQIGLDSIYFWLRDKDAMLFLLRWA